MKPEFFQQQMKRLEDCFGEKFYNSDRKKILWNEMQGLDDDVFKNAISALISEHRQAPLVPDIRVAVGTERSKAWTIQKRIESDDWKKSASTFGLEEIGLICETIRKRIRDELSSLDFSAAMKSLDGVIKPQIGRSDCCSDGYVFRANEFGNDEVWRCWCSKGQNRPKAYPVFRNKVN